MNAFVPAGGIPHIDDPLYEAAGGGAKALIDIEGRPMVQWVLDALGQSQHIDRVALIGLDASAGLTCAKPLSYLPEHGGMLRNVMAGLSWSHATTPEQAYVVYAAADVPTVTPEIIDWRIEAGLAAVPFDLDYVAVERSVMEARFPASNRSYVGLKDVDVCGGDVNLVRAEMAIRTELWDRLVATRKSPLRQAALAGIDTLVLMLFRRLTLAQAEVRLSERLGIVGRAHLAPYAELAMDVDKPHQLEVVRRDMAKGRQVPA